jgi:hypothetical protein
VVAPRPLKRAFVRMSIMEQFNDLYRYCFHPTYKDKCDYNYISWNYADARRHTIYGFDTLNLINTQYSEFINLIGLVKGIKLATPVEDWDIPPEINTATLLTIGNELESKMRRKYKNRDEFSLPDYLNRLLLIINNIPFFINELFKTDLIKSQLDKLSDELKLVFTQESFINLVKFYTTKSKIGPGWSTLEINKFSTLLTNLISFYTTTNKGEKDRIANEINRTIYTDNEFLFILNGPSAYYACVLDIYFILRSNRKEQHKLVVGYFGSNHSASIVNYFTEIIKTHTVLNTSEGEGFIDITDTIDLRYLTSIRAGTRKRRVKKRVTRAKKVLNY